jgi:hypothetical protein
MNRGDVVTLDFSLYDPADKVRPTLVVQNDRDNARMAKTIVALITTNIRRAEELNELCPAYCALHWTPCTRHLQGRNARRDRYNRRLVRDWPPGL